jgi:uncharacterized protein (TIGR02246 family)
MALNMRRTHPWTAAPESASAQTRETKAIATNSQASVEVQIRELTENSAEAVRAKDIDGAMAHIAPDVVVFDVVNPLQSLGVDAARKRLKEWFASFQGPIDYEIRDLRVTTNDNVAFSHSLNRVRGTKTDGGHIEMWWRATVGYRKIDGQWLATHEHSSVPFDVESGRASLDLKP